MNPYTQQITAEKIFQFLFEDDEKAQSQQAVQEEKKVDDTYLPTAPSEDDQYELALEIALGTGENPYIPKSRKLGNQAGNGVSNQGVNPYVTKTGNEIMEQYGLSNLGVWGDARHQKKQSDHNTGDAQDFGVNNPVSADSAISQLQREAKERNIKYIIYNGRIWNPSISDDWRPYTGTNKHTTHFHVSYNR